jgi:3-oxoacyl-[acyl-carrier-protein] synthase-1
LFAACGFHTIRASGRQSLVTNPLSLVAHAARTPVGLIAETSAAAVRARLTRFEEFPFVGAHGEPIFAAADLALAPGLTCVQRILSLVWAVLDVTAQKLGGLGYAGPLRLILVLPEPRPGFGPSESHALLHSLQRALTERGWPIELELGPTGHAGVARSLERLIEEGPEHALQLVVAADSYLHGAPLEWLEREGLLADPRTPNGLIPGEAAACLMLASEPLRARLRLPVLARVVASSCAVESLARDSVTGSLGEALSAAVLAATRTLELPRDTPSTVYIDINGERYRSEEWGFVNLRASEVFGPAPPIIPADSWGDVGAASGALFAILAAQSWARGYAVGRHALCLTSSLAGLRGATLLESP